MEVAALDLQGIEMQIRDDTSLGLGDCARCRVSRLSRQSVRELTALHCEIEKSIDDMMHYR
jgi:hypothetical protein